MTNELRRQQVPEVVTRTSLLELQNYKQLLVLADRQEMLSDWLMVRACVTTTTTTMSFGLGGGGDSVAKWRYPVDDSV